jgi:hypothetical protein
MSGPHNLAVNKWLTDPPATGQPAAGLHRAGLEADATSGHPQPLLPHTRGGARCRQHLLRSLADRIGYYEDHAALFKSLCLDPQNHFIAAINEFLESAMSVATYPLSPITFQSKGHRKTYWASPFPNDQFSFGTSTRLMNTSSLRASPPNGYVP